MSEARQTEILEKSFDTDKINVGVASSVLPTGASTETTLDAIKTLNDTEHNTQTDCKQVITIENVNLQDGKTFSVTNKFDLTSEGTRKITFETNSVHRIRFKPTTIVSSVDKLTFNAYEGSSGNTGGDTLTPVNRNRTSDYATDVIIKSGATVTTNGTIIHSSYIPGATGVGGSKTGASRSDEYGWILKPDTVYTLEFYNGSNSTNTVFVEFLWFENTPG